MSAAVIPVVIVGAGPSGVTAAWIGFGSVFWVCAALAAVAAGLLLARAAARS